MAEPPQDLLPLLRAKLEATTAEISTLQAELTRVRDRFDAKIKHAPNKPPMSEEALQGRIDDLEFARSTSSMSLAKEKELMREVSQLRTQKMSLGSYAAFQEELDSLKAQRTDLGDRVRAAQSTVRELRDYVRKLEILERVRAANPDVDISTADLRVAEIKVAIEHVPRLIGRKGQTLREIENAAGVTIDVETSSDLRRGGPREEPGAAPAASHGGAGAGSRGGDRKDHKGGDRKGDGKGAKPAAAAKPARPAAASAASDAEGEGASVSVKIMGLEAGIMQAVNIIEAIAAQVESVLPAAPGVLSYLLARGGAGVKDLESAHGVKLRVDRAEGTVTARGSPPAVEAVRTGLAGLASGRAVVAVDRRTLPAVIGKGGANLKRLRESSAAEIDIVRHGGGAEGGDDEAAAGEGDGGAELHVFGPPDAVLQTVAELHALIADVREVDEAIEVPRDAVPWLVGSGGERISAFQKETGAFARIQRHNETAEGGAASSVATVALRGTPAAMEAARPAFQRLMAEYARCNVILTVSPAQARALVGPAGATIKRLRAETGAAIEVVEHGDEERREAKRSGKKHKAGEAAAGKDGGDKAAAAAAGGGEDSKQQRRPPRHRAEELGVPAGQAAVTVRGDDADTVAGAVAAVSAVIREYAEMRLPVPASVVAALIARHGEAIGAIQAACGCTVDLLRERDAVAADAAAAAAAAAEGRPAPSRTAVGVPSGGGAIVVLTGVSSAVSAGAARLRELHASTAERVLALPDAGAVGEIVGKGGAAIRALRDALRVEIDVDKAALTVTLTGDAAALDAAAAHVSSLLAAYSRGHAVLYLDPDLVPGLIGKGGAAIRALQEETGATVHAEAGTGQVRIEGGEAAVAAAKARIAALCHLDQAAEAVPLEPAALARLTGRGRIALRRLEEAHRVSVTVDAPAAEGVAVGAGVTIRGEASAIAGARLALKRLAREAQRVEEAVEVPAARVPALAGRGGARLRQLEADTGAAVELPGSGGGGPRGGDHHHYRGKAAAAATAVASGGPLSLRVRGTALAVAKARAVLAALAAGAGVRCLVRPAAHLAELRGRDARALAALQQAEAAARVTLFDAEPPAEGDEAAAGGDEPQGLVLVTAPTDAAASRAALAVDKLVAFRHGDGYAVVQAPAGVLEALAGRAGGPQRGKRAAAAAKATKPKAKAAAGAGADADAEGEEEDAEEEAAAADEEAAAADEEEEAAAAADSGAALPTLASIVASAGAAGGAVDREGGYVALWGAPPAVAAARAAVDAAAALFASRHAEVAVDGWAVPALIGKAGKGIAALEAATGCRVHVEREGGGSSAAAAAAGHGGGGPSASAFDTSRALVRIVAPSAAALAAAAARIGELAASFARRRVLLSVPAAAFGAIIGKGGAAIRALQEATGASVDLDRDRGLVAVRGPTEAAVAAGRAALTAAVEEAGHTVAEATAAELAVPAPRTLTGLDKAGVASLVARAGALVRRLQDQTACRISVDRERGSVAVAGACAEDIAAGAAAVLAAVAEGAAAAAAAASAAPSAAAAHAPADAADAGSATGAAAGPRGSGAPPRPPSSGGVVGLHLTPEERLAAASKRGGKAERKRERARLLAEGVLLAEGGSAEAHTHAPAAATHWFPPRAAEAAAARAAPAAAAAAAAASAIRRPAAAAAAPAPVPRQPPVAAAAAAAPPAAVAAAPRQLPAASPATVPLNLPLRGGGGGAASTVRTSAVALPAGLLGIGGGAASSNDILAALLGRAPAAAAAAAPSVAAAPPPAVIAAPTPQRAAAAPPPSLPVASSSAVSPPPRGGASVPAASPSKITTLPLSIGSFSIGGFSYPGTAASAASAAALALAPAAAPKAATSAAAAAPAAAPGGVLSPITFAAFDVTAASRAAPAHAAGGGASAAARSSSSAAPAAVAARGPPPGLPAASSAQQRGGGGGVAMSPAGFDLSSLSASLLGIAAVPQPATRTAAAAAAVAVAPAAARAPPAALVSPPALPAAAAVGKSAAAAALLLSQAPGAAPVAITSLASLLSGSPAKAAAGRGGAAGGRVAAAPGPAGRAAQSSGVYAAAGGVHVRL